MVVYRDLSQQYESPLFHYDVM